MTRPFHVVNYLGSLGGGRLLGRRGMVWVFDRIAARLQASVRRGDDRAFARGMHLPTGWGPYFTDYRPSSTSTITAPGTTTTTEGS